MLRDLQCLQNRLGQVSHCLISRYVYTFAFNTAIVFSATNLFPKNLDAEDRISQIVLDSAPVDTNSPNLIRLQPLDAEGLYSPVVTALAASEDGRWLVAAGDDHAIRVVERSTGLLFQLLEGHVDWVQSVALIDNGESILSCGNDGTLRLWSLDNSNITDSGKASCRVLHQSSVALMCLAVSPDEKHVAVGGFGKSIWVYDLQTGDLVLELICECGDQRALAFSRDGLKIACGGRDGVLRVWMWNEAEENSKHALEQTLHQGRIRSVSFNKDDTIVTTIAEDRRLVRYRIYDGQVLLDQKIPGGKLMAMTPLDSDLFAIAGADNTIRIIEASAGSEVHRLIGHDGSVVVLLRNGNDLISSSYDTTIRYWNINKATERDPTPYEHPVSARYVDSGVSENIR